MLRTEGYEAWEEWSHSYENTSPIYSLTSIKEPEQYIAVLRSLKNSIVVITYRGQLQEDQINKNILGVMYDAGLCLDLSNGVPYLAVLADGVLMDQLQAGN